MSTCYITFSVNVSNSSYSYNATKKGDSECRIEITEEDIESLDAGNMLSGLLKSAMRKYNNPPKEEE